MMIPYLGELVKWIVEMTPKIVGATVVFILIFGLMAVDFVGDAIAAIGREAKIEYASIASLLVRGIFYLVVIIVGLSTMRIDVTILNMIVTALAWGLAGAIALGGGLAIGFGFKDVVAKKAEDWIKKASEVAKAVKTEKE